MRFGLKQFRQQGCLSYVLSDRETRAAAIVDPRVDMMDEYRSFFADHGLKPVCAIDTHIHADHFSATHFFQAEYGAVVAMSEKTRSARPGLRLKAGSRLEIGGLALETLETPGHTADSISLAGHGMVFTGDTLFIGSTGRTDFPTADPAAQFDSIHAVLGALPDGTVLLPGHDYSELIFSTIGAEKSRNPHWLIPTREEFVAMKRNELIPTSMEETRKKVEFNSSLSPQGSSGQECVGASTACGMPLGDTGAVASISVEKFSHKLKERGPGVEYVDVREVSEFTEGHMPGAINIPLSEVAFHFERLSQAKRVYLSCLSGRRSLMVAKNLSYLGLPDVVNVSGGYKAWVQSGLPTVK